ncbi:uncharacterized protein AB675_1582 [Cyphellophora attinorum]|uniref:Magnesium transport protein CorA n=1 Tax=Cyphellophora attinorum TaxID=1664694 RepID=A0A0N1NZD3_9EURO|nr:uncharacterized protein AB675_1582 [Phialophora attinorum]KPI37180.1 hypothetical protein AB675_1582 [Phialophora attinorum]
MSRTSIPLVAVDRASTDERMQNPGPQGTSDQVTPDEYGRAIHNFARLSDGDGRAFQPLAEYLSGSTCASATVPTEAFVTLYTFDQNASRTERGSLDGSSQPLHASRSLPDHEVTAFTSPENFYSHPVSDQASQIVFLGGFPSPLWLKSIGAKYKLDPEFFRRHLDFLDPHQVSSAFSEPSLPSETWHLLQLPVYTLGLKHIAGRRERPDDHATRRSKAQHALIAHHRQLRIPSGTDDRLGKSIVRNYHVLDDSHFAIEQRISICLQESRSSYVLFVWLDSTLKWDSPMEEPWCPRRPLGSQAAVELLPIVRYRHNLALKSHRIKAKSRDPVPFGAPQSAALIHHDYVRASSPNVVRQDASYAITELLRLSAASQSQFLNLLNSDVVLERPSSISTDEVPSVIYRSQILSSMSQQTHEVRQCMRNIGESHWTKAPEGSSHKKATQSWGALEADHECLRERTRMVSDRYKEAVVILMNTMAIAESREGIVQAKKVSRLTSLAFIFVPLSFTTSFFGMNVQQLSQQKTSIWIWFVVSIILSGIAMAFLFSERCVGAMKEVRARLRPGKAKSPGEEAPD